MHTTLKHLQLMMRSPTSNQKAAVKLVSTTIASCEDNIQILDATLQKFQTTLPNGKRESIRILSKKALFPFRQNTLRGLENIMAKLQANVEIAIQALQL